MAAVAQALALPKSLQVPEIPEVFRGRELTPKHSRLPSGLPTLDAALGGGLVRGRINELIGPLGRGKTSLAASFLARATARGETAAWIDLAGAFDPATMSAAGADLTRILWVGCAGARPSGARERDKIFLKAAELILETGGFGLVTLDFGARRFPLMTSAALRLARRAERSSTAVLMLAARRMGGTFAALTIDLYEARARFSRPSRMAPALFDGLAIEARIARHKLGGAGARVAFQAWIDPALELPADERRRRWAASDAS